MLGGEIAIASTVANDGLADLVAKYPDRFIAFIAPSVDNPDESMKEMDRAVTQLDARGIMIYTTSR